MNLTKKCLGAFFIEEFKTVGALSRMQNCMNGSVHCKLNIKDKFVTVNFSSVLPRFIFRTPSVSTSIRRLYDVADVV